MAPKNKNKGALQGSEEVEDALVMKLCPPFSGFFIAIMYTFDLHLLDLTPYTVACMAIFAHLCENFAGLKIDKPGKASKKKAGKKKADKAEEVDKPFKLPAAVVPMCNNSAQTSIIAMMPVFDAHGLDQTWAEPDAARVQEFFNSLSERPICEEKQLVHDTTDEEVAYIANMAEEAALAEAASSAGFQESEAGAEEDFAEQVESTGERSGTATGGPSAEEADKEAADDTDEEESPEEPPVQGRRKRVLRQSGSSEPVRRASSPKEVPVKKATGKAAPRQGGQTQPVRHTRRTTAAAEGAAAAASAAAKRRRSPSPPLRTDTIPEADYDLSGMSPNRRGPEEEDEERDE
nr:translation initiation factor IF-2-like [Aegilops tauschii subsp. strangulata]